MHIKNKLLSYYKIFINFPLCISFSMLRAKIINFIFKQNSSLVCCMYYKQHLAIEKYLLSRGYVDNAPACSTKLTETDNFRVWIYWAQGWNSPPINVKRNLASVRKNMSWADIVCIDDSNFSDFVEIAPVILEKREKGIISTTHFSDILRAYLLTEYGGVWLDASAFICRPIKKEELYLPYFTIRCSKDITNGICVSRARYSGSFSGTKYYQYPLFKMMKNVFIQYWDKEDCLINYFLIDYVTYLIMLRNKNIVSDMVKNNISDFTYIVNEYINTTNTGALFEKGNESTKILYLSWKKRYFTNVNGKQTLYGKILAMNYIE